MDQAKSQIDRLGLKTGRTSDADLRDLEEYRASFKDPYSEVIAKVGEETGIDPTGRPAKTTRSIVDKLHRESIRLSQMQDVAGCRIVVDDIVAQERALERLRQVFPEARVVDRRARPSSGYRAVHVVVFLKDRPIEVQLRTWLQHHWAELSEKLSDRFGIDVKYGGGEFDVQVFLRDSADEIAAIEDGQLEHAGISKQLDLARQRGAPSVEIALLEKRLDKMTKDLEGAEDYYFYGAIEFMSGLDVDL